MKTINVKRASRARSWAMVLLAFLPACSDRVGEPEGGTLPTSTIEAGITARAGTLAMPNRSADDLKEKTASLLRLFPGGTQVSRVDVDIEVAPRSRSVLAARQVPRVRIEYDEKTDTLDLIDVELSSVRDGIEVSETAAKGRFEGLLTALVARGVVRSNEYDVADVKVSRVMQGVGYSLGGPPVESVKEYRFFVPRRVGGIILNDSQHDLGLRVMIHRSGELRGIRISGAGVTLSPGGAVVERVDVGELDKRVISDFPDSTVEPLGLRYSLGGPGGEPRRVYRVSRRAVVDGRVVNGRAKLVYYSISDDAGSPDIWPTPNPEDKSDSPKLP